MEISTLNRLALKYKVLVKSDSPGFQRRARILQSVWREEQGYAPGMHKGKFLGSRLAMPEAQEKLSNYLDDDIREVVRAEVLDPDRSKDKLYSKPRIFNDLLSSQPLCFNLFGKLQQNLAFASAVFSDLTAGRVHRVTDIKFEWSPGRGSPIYTHDRSAFDVYVCYQTRNGGVGFIGVEVKYHENLRGSVSHNPRYDEIADLMNCFRSGCRPKFHQTPLHQIWRDHLLAGIHRLVDSFEDGFFLFLYPKGNDKCTEAVGVYRECLSDEETFAAWTLEDIAAAIQYRTKKEWINHFIDRYLNFDKLARYIV
jgi:hypothetical protein